MLMLPKGSFQSGCCDLDEEPYECKTDKLTKITHCCIFSCCQGLHVGIPEGITSYLIYKPVMQQTIIISNDVIFDETFASVITYSAPTKFFLFCHAMPAWLVPQYAKGLHVLYEIYPILENSNQFV